MTAAKASAVCIPRTTEEERERIWDDTEAFVRPDSSRADLRLHLPHPNRSGEPACQKAARYDTEHWITKPSAVYPPGHKPLCLLCVEHWRDGQ